MNKMKRSVLVSFLKYGDVSPKDKKNVKRAIAKNERRNARVVINEYCHE